MKTTPFPSHARHAFTLIELLTVIAIIGILAGILIPVVGTVRDNARAAKCVSNLRSTGTAMINHINDNNGFLRTFKGGSPTSGIWTNVLRDEGYYQQRTGSYAAETIHCPSWGYRETGHHFDGYGLNLYDPQATTVSTPEAGNQYTRNFNDPDVTPSRYILFADSYRGTNRLQVFRLVSNNTHADGSIHVRHNGRANVVFLDGHVESCDPVRLGQLEPAVRGGYDFNEQPLSFPQP
jgi:prepilin-type processing-associated H-X9-DG protein/prepilin-type N-terminal cleavage/methylation domain-containing protein